jgi:amino acid transporter
MSAGLLGTPRLTFAMAEQGDLPAFFAAVHPRFRTPHISIVVFSIMLLAFSILADFRWNTTISAVSRLVLYSSVVAALPVLRRKQPQANAFRLPYAGLFVAIALVFVGMLVVRLHWPEMMVIAVTSGLATLNWAWTLMLHAGNKSMASVKIEL